VCLGDGIEEEVKEGVEDGNKSDEDSEMFDEVWIV
jgi:hypothetical protein